MMDTQRYTQTKRVRYSPSRNQTMKNVVLQTNHQLDQIQRRVYLKLAILVTARMHLSRELQDCDFANR